MKLYSSLICSLVLSSFLAVSAFAQKIETESELFSKISVLTKTKKASDQDKAYELSKTFLSKFGSQNNEETKKVKDFVENYQMATLGKRIEEGKTAEAFAFGKDILTREPENAFVTANLAYAGYQAAQNKKDKTYLKDSVDYAKQTLKIYEAKKLPKSFQPFTDESEATALMYYIVGHLSVDTDMTESAKNFYKAVQYTSKIKNNSYPYYIIATSYYKEYEAAAKAFDAKYGANSAASAERTAEEARLFRLIARMQDAFARAVKLGEAEKAAGVAEWKQQYVQIYTFNTGSDRGLEEFLAKVLETPMPDPNAP